MGFFPGKPLRSSLRAQASISPLLSLSLSLNPNRSKNLSMSSLARLRLLSLGRYLSSSATAILNPSSPTTPFTAHQKSRAALSLLRTEKDPTRIADICRAAALTPFSHLDRLSLSHAISSLSASGDVASIRSVLTELLLSPHPDDRPRSHAIVLFGQAGLLDDAIQTFLSAPSLRALNALLFACILAKKHTEVTRIFRDFPTAHSITPDVDTYNTVIKSLAESGSTGSAYSLLDEMHRVGIKPNTTTYSTMLTGFYQEERFDDVKEVLKLMKKHACHPGLTIYNVRIQSLCKLKRPGEAIELLKEMREKLMKPNSVTYNHLIYGFCVAGDLEEAKRLYKEMPSRGLVPESQCCFSLISHLCSGGDLASALEVCKECLEKKWVPPFKTMKALVNALIDSLKFEEAREIIEKVKEKFPSGADRWKEVEERLPQ